MKNVTNEFTVIIFLFSNKMFFIVQNYDRKKKKSHNQKFIFFWVKRDNFIGRKPNLTEIKAEAQ